MANSLTTDPIVLDTAGSAIDFGRVFNIFTSVEWVGATTIAHTASLTDGDGNTICSFKCDVANRSLIKYFPDRGAPFHGPFTFAKDSGTLYIKRL